MAVCPFADQSRRYDRKYAGSYVSGARARGVLHSTETTGLPSYEGGAVAPHFTYDPRTGHIWQHFDTARPSRALAHLPGTIDTNNMRAIQIEIVAYSDAGAALKAGGLRVDRLSSGQMAVLAKLMRWIEATSRVSRSCSVVFKAYPGSAGISNGVRMSSSRWLSYGEWCGHEHVPGNVHGDPSDLAMRTLLQQLLPTPTMEDRDVMYLIGVTGKAAEFLCVNNDDLIWVQDGDHEKRINLMYRYLFRTDIHKISTADPSPLERGLYGFLKGPSPSDILPGETKPREPGWNFQRAVQPTGVSA